MQNKVFFKRHNYIRMFIHMQRLYQIGLNIKLCICQFTLPADLDISVERVFNIVYILVKFVMIIIFLFLHHSIMLCESEVLTYQGIVKHRILIFIHFQLDFQYDKICFQHRDGGASGAYY